MTRSLALALALALSACSPGGDASAAFAGRWYYRHPNPSSGEGIAQLHCPASASSPALDIPLPQIGWIDLVADGDTHLSGTTDQGCTWSFTVSGANATLSSSTQNCFNRNIGSSYSIPEWSMTLAGDGTLLESLRAVSHQSVDCDFVLASASRARPSSTPDPAAAFVGTWRLDPPDPAGGNVAIVSCPTADGGVPTDPPSYVPQLGTMRIERTADHTVAVTTDAGCTSTLSVEGHSAELASPASSCTEGPIPTFWSFETDGDDAYQTISGTLNGCTFVLSNSHLTLEGSS